jgi:diguanylate cyclase (GGDEF)-like protein/PAS domain S-box-containing protein
MPQRPIQQSRPDWYRFFMPCLLLLFFAVPMAVFAQNNEIRRHALETKALVEPKAVLAELPQRLQAAKAASDNTELSLLLLAQSNACRVIADWKCQRDSALEAGLFAKTAGDAHLQTRALISQGRAQMAMQAYSAAEQIMGEAEQLLQENPSPSLMADVMLAYSSLSFGLNNHDLSVEYADRGLAALGQLPALSVRIRLIRNKARALSELGNDASALEMLKTASALSAQLNDPKLNAELYLEQARLSREQRDVAAQRTIGQRVLELAEQLDNGQLRGLGHEVLGYAALDSGNGTQALNELDIALGHFRKLELMRDERRALRELLQIEIMQKRPASELRARTGRLIELEKQLEIDDRKIVANSLNAQLQYAQQKIDMETLKVNAALAAEKAEAAESRQRATLIMAFLSISLLISLGVFSAFQRRNAKRLQQANMELNASETRMRAIADNVPAFIAQIDGDQHYRFANAFIAKRYGRSPESITGMSIRELRGNAIADEMQPHIQKVLQGEQVRFEVSESIDGNTFHYQSSYVPDFDIHGKVQGFYLLGFDISDLKKAEAKLAEMARIDSLTGAANRRLFDEALPAATARMRREGRQAALLCLDIDHFKSINDNYGHPVGDAVIIAFSKRLQQCIREVDLLARLGGDEFVILIESAPPGSAETIAEKILAAMQQPITVDGHDLQVGTSIGVAYSGPASTDTDFFKQADQALYEAKKAGRNRLHALPA